MLGIVTGIVGAMFVLIGCFSSGNEIVKDLGIPLSLIIYFVLWGLFDISNKISKLMEKLEELLKKD